MSNKSNIGSNTDGQKKGKNDSTKRGTSEVFKEVGGEGRKIETFTACGTAGGDYSPPNRTIY